MGGDTDSVQSSIIANSDDNLFTTKPEFSLLSGEIPALRSGRSFRDHHNTSEIEENEKRKNSIYAQVIKSYDDLTDRVENMEVAKQKVLSYTPGSWVENIGGMTPNVPKTTTLLLIGPKGSGKSSLVNRISRVFEDDKFAPDRAQATYNSSICDGTRFLQEYMIPRNSTSFCLYDTCGFSDVLYENLKMIEQWVTKGVCHGELANSAMYSSCFLARMNCETRQDEFLTYERRRVDFVIFVVNGLSVLECMEISGADTPYMYRVAKIFNSPFLSFKDHKPVIAITHGDLLSISERARVRVFLGDTLGVHPSKQTFDIPDDCEPITEVAIVDLVRYALEHADRNLPFKSRSMISKGSTIQLWAMVHLLLILAAGILMFTVNLHGFSSPKSRPESVSQPDLEIKKVTKIGPEIVPEHIAKIKEVIPESIPKPSKKTKNVDAERTTKKKQKMNTARVPEPNLRIDWKSIRHVW
ncbi:hypothetical protein E3N88_21974 [Mikania micrantha]|uniref:Uncharacterized protein n=1 Tax=Mikania micrantha TaxID=192012 RepID=A0A5N6NAL3_9ASTR|nr:hypothetical protein E3N88_21974 [Mikania micrantha]